jgi:hypothetical protein
MTPEAVAAMLDADRAEWAALTAALDARPDGPLHDPESPHWTARDVYTHLARMMESTTTILAKLAGVAVPEAGPFDEFGRHDGEDAVNARIQAKYASLPLAGARAWAQRTFDERIRVIQTVPSDRWDARLDDLARADGGDHYRGHRNYIATPRAT